MKKEEKNILDLITKYLDSNKTEYKLNVLKEELDKNPEHRRIFDEINDIWQSSKKVKDSDDYDQYKAWSALKKKICAMNRRFDKALPLIRFSLIHKITAAAIVILILGIFGIIYYTKNNTPVLNTEYYIPYGSRSQLKLPDGSNVWLNSGSKLIYNNQFNHKNRDVFLEGEAYFDISRNEGIPFLVKTSEITIKVLGTQFDVKAYPEEDVIEATVAKGIVQIISNLKNESIHKFVLKENQKASINKKQNLKDDHYMNDFNYTDYKDSNSHALKNTIKHHNISINKNIATEIYTSWKDSRWIIEREELQSLAVKIERRYNVNIKFKDDSIKKYVFSGVLEDETLEQILEAIKLTAPINYEIKQKQVLLFRNIYYRPKN